MVKKKVISLFIGLIVFTGIIFFIQMNAEKNLTGSIVDDAKLPNPEGFTLSIDNYNVKPNLIEVQYNLKDNSGKDGKFDVTYFIHDDALNVLKTGTESVLLEAGKSMDYFISFAFDNPNNNDIYLTLLASNGDIDKRVTVPIGSSSNHITGSTIKDMKMEAVNYFLVMFIALLVLFYCVKAIYSFRIQKSVRRYTAKDRFISVHH